MITDSNHEPNEVLIQNPEHLVPEDVMRGLGLMHVQYLGFDDKLHQGQIIVATRVMPDVEAFFHQALEIGFPIGRVIPVSAPQYHWNRAKIVKDNVSAGFDSHTIGDTDKLSPHSYGHAFDINPKQNPSILYPAKKAIPAPNYGTWNPAKPGTLYAKHPLVKLMEGFGWQWGGHWPPDNGRTDYMHFQKSE